MLRFRYRPRDAQPAHVELLGEVGDWLNPIPLKVSDGAFEASLELPPGVYEYKFRVDGRWSLDPGNERTRSSDGARNNVAVVGGAPEPLLFAPAAPFVHPADGGGVTITALVRKGASASLDLWWSETGAPRRGDPMATNRTALPKAAEEDEHLVFRARLPASSRRLWLLFGLDNGRFVGDESGEAFVYDPPPAGAPLPGWWYDAVVYTIFVDRFRPREDGPSWNIDPGRDRAAGGDLHGVVRSLDELAELGATVLYLTPVHPAASCHRYDVIDPLAVDPALGGGDAFRQLISEAHARGMRIVLDFSFAHVGAGFPAYDDVRAHGRASRFAAWLKWNRDAPALYGKRDDAALLDLDHPEVRDLVIHAASFWAGQGVDGFRLDAAAETPIDLARDIRGRLRAHNPEAVAIGDLAPAHSWRWRSAGAIDVATEFGFQDAVLEFLAWRNINARTVAERLMRLDRQRGAPPSSALRFLSTHDHSRHNTVARSVERPASPELALMLLFTSPGTPALLYGEEIGLAAEVVSPEPENVWPDRMPMVWRRNDGQQRLWRWVRALIAARRDSAALRRGDTEMLVAGGRLLGYRRSAGGDIMDVVINADDEPAAVELNDDVFTGIEPVVTAGKVGVQNQRVTLGGLSAAILRRRRPPQSARSLSVRQNTEVRNHAFLTTAAEVHAYPGRIDFAVTERCNLRCNHCITRAPQRTASGAARTLSPWLLDRLRGALGYASYFGFVHGGESLTAPVFFDVLEAIREARGGEPYVVHVLTNGQTLTGRVVRRLVDLGVRSLSVSLDGATAEVNDAVREGGRFDTIVANLTRAVILRSELAAGLRLGVSTVVMEQNRHQLSDLVELCARIGVDWIKLEEMAPVNAYAERSLVPLTGGPGRDAVQRALERARELGLTAVDHTADREVWRCKLDEQPGTSAFLEADEFANRSTIHPCRVAWDHACIEPNGEVKIGDFSGPPVGNLADGPFLALWNSPAAQAVRRSAPHRRLCGAGPVTCIGDDPTPSG